MKPRRKRRPRIFTVMVPVWCEGEDDYCLVGWISVDASYISYAADDFIILCRVPYGQRRRKGK